MSYWAGEVCKRCGRRNPVGFAAPDALWVRVVCGAWNVLCLTCFDEVAEEKGIQYRGGEFSLYHVSWSDWVNRP